MVVETPACTLEFWLAEASLIPGCPVGPVYVEHSRVKEESLLGVGQAVLTPDTVTWPLGTNN